MAIKHNTLSNGLTVATDSMSGIETATVSVLVKAGSRNEKAEDNGISHFLEHMAFKGTARRNAKQIAEEFDDIGGYFNAYTSREKTVYYAKILKDDMDVAVDILSDILQNSLLDQEEIEKERGVILQEIAQNDDTPDDLIFDHFQEVAYPDQAFGKSILGTQDFIKSVTREQIVNYVNNNYSFDNVIVTAAGNINDSEFESRIASQFNGFQKSGNKFHHEVKYKGGDVRLSKDLEQVHIVIGYEGVSYRDPMFYTQQILSIISGGGMSSRLFQEIRENRGLAYSVSAFGSSYSDNGIFGIYAGLGADDVNECIDVIAAELHKMTSELTEVELKRAKAQVRAGVLMSQESSVSRAEKLAGNIAVHGRYMPVEEMLRNLDAVNIDGLHSFARRLFVDNNPITFASIGHIDKVYDYDIADAKLRLKQ